MPVAQLGLEFLSTIRNPLLQDLVQTLGAPLSPDPAGDVQEGREVLDHQPVRVAHRADELRGPDLAAVFGVEHHFLIERLLGPHGGPDAAFHLGIGVRSSEEEVVLTEHLLAGVAAEIDEGLVHVNDRVVVEGGIRDDHGHAGGLDGRHERTTPAMKVLDPLLGSVLLVLCVRRVAEDRGCPPFPDPGGWP